ncbi:PepSY domain-containing protein [Larsenimonas rhizosphaerae]|uniref:PepSY domain-containing protein n=1 Tax=Larsenimonas rhizosphaerae TaxID=2944682 RepID=A0AA41ZHV0_9GAMM|nr:PepSY domain-containing protein [Larsenimonas rhizosphaerae]MCM2131632.1 PepSY domain-containing protein [Larsenimonas rhizosphaerae]MCX2525042.1 PepSY domain-containing protein [Larsenimonas rhizosphaerae]
MTLAYHWPAAAAGMRAIRHPATFLWIGGPCLVLVCLMAMTQPCQADLSQDDVLRLTRSGHIIEFPAILEKARRHHSGKLLEAELEKEHDRYIYEIDILDDQGTVWELKFDAVTGDYITASEEK